VCTQPAGWGTAHPGQGRCKLHGGNNVIRHGRYSQVKRAEIRDLIERHESDPDPLNAFGELAATRALFEDYINRYTEITEALIAWHASWSAVNRPFAQDRINALETVCDEMEALIGPADLDDEDDGNEKVRAAIRDARELIDDLARSVDETKPRKLLDITIAKQLLDSITQQIDAIKKREEATHISVRDFYRIMGEMGRAVDLIVSDDDTKQKIKDAWLTIRRD
jgi:hypothetical protein